MSDRWPDLLSPALDSSGNPISGAKLNFYVTGTSTRKDTYTTSAKTAANANPVIALSGGRFPEIFMDTDAAYKVVFTDAADVEIWSKDPVYPILPPGTFPIIAVSSKSSNYTVLATDRGADILVDASSGPATITLLPVVTAASGFVLTVVKTDSSVNVVTVDANAAELIGADTTVGLGEQFDTIEIGTEATFWYIKSEKRLPTPQVANADEIVTVNAAGTGFTTSTSPLPISEMPGLTLSNNATDATNDIDIAIGKCRDTADTANITIAAALGKQLGVSWAAGGTPAAPVGGLSSSLTLTNDTTYHAIAGLVSGTADVIFDTSATGANAVTDHSMTNPRRIGSVRRLTAANELFFQNGDEFLKLVPDVEFNTNSTGTAAVVRTLEVPLGIRVHARLNVSIRDSTAGGSLGALITSMDQTDTAAGSAGGLNNLVIVAGAAGGEATSVNFDILTNTSGEVRTRYSRSSTTAFTTGYTFGWTDRRGRDG